MAHKENLTSDQVDRAEEDNEVTDIVEAPVQPHSVDTSEQKGEAEQRNLHEPTAPLANDIDQQEIEIVLESSAKKESLTEITLGPSTEVEALGSTHIDPPEPDSSKLDKPVEYPLVNGKKIDKRDVETPFKQLGHEDFTVMRKQGSIRHIVAVLALSSIVLANMNRQVFNQALVSMTKMKSPTSAVTEPVMITTDLPEYEETKPETTTQYIYQNPDFPGVDVVEEANEHKLLIDIIDEVSIDDDRYEWDGGQISTLQAAFSYGYMPFMILGGRLSELYGAKWVVFLSGFGSALCCVFLPFFADSSFELLVASRVLMGLCQTGVSPALYALLTRWLPQDESSVYLPMIKVGVMVGYMCGSLVVGFFPWRLTFYMTGLIGLLWCGLWVIMVTSDPSDHKLIGSKELEYIRWEIRRLNKGRQQSIGEARKKAAPWKNILTNPVVVAFMFSKFTVKLSTDAQSMQIPMYLKNVFQVSKELNGVLSATNFALQGVFTGLVAWTAKEFGVRKVLGLDKTGVRRLFQGINSFGMATAFILMTFNMSSLTFVVFTVIMVSVTSMFGAGGEAVTPVDLSTEYAASIMAIANSLANTSGIVLPPLITFVLNNDLESADNWNLAFRILGGIVLSGGVVYTCFVTAELQDFTKSSLEPKAKIAQEKVPEVAIEMKPTSKDEVEKDG